MSKAGALPPGGCLRAAGHAGNVGFYPVRGGRRSPAVHSYDFPIGPLSQTDRFPTLTEGCWRPDASASPGPPMLDFVFLLAGIGFFGVLQLYAVGCAHLQELPQ